ncbi:MAG: NAD(P)/FAD-dependent oxidoreductase [Azospirillaceae bacterium]|nr:NAD(P)/FAD-dependent oxidoreductase [Azospirillaceae bacterium]
MVETPVAIIGAGLGGLCLAQALTRAGIDCAVYERDAALDSRPQGYRLRIDADGQAALAHCLPPSLYDLFRRTCARPGPMPRFLDSGLDVKAARAPASWETGAGPDDGADLCAHRQTLREILMRGIEPRVHFGKTFDVLAVRADGGARVTFSDGTHINAGLVVAADGLNSSVRRLLAPQADPLDTGAVCLYGRTTLTPPVRVAVGDVLVAGTTVVFADGCAAVIDPMRFDWPAAAGGLTRATDYLYWALVAPRSRLGAPGPVLGMAAADVAGRLMDGWHPHLRALVDFADADGLALVPVRSARLARTWPAWGDGPVTFLGDAIHAMSPAGGLGANTALRDAAELAARLAGPLSPQAAARDYEIEMRTRAARAIHLSEQGAAALFADVI